MCTLGVLVSRVYCAALSTLCGCGLLSGHQLGLASAPVPSSHDSDAHVMHIQMQQITVDSAEKDMHHQDTVQGQFDYNSTRTNLLGNQSSHYKEKSLSFAFILTALVTDQMFLHQVVPAQKYHAVRMQCSAHNCCVLATLS